jgi:hypothetical protein
MTAKAVRLIQLYVIKSQCFSEGNLLFLSSIKLTAPLMSCLLRKKKNTTQNRKPKDEQNGPHQ